MKKFMKLSVLFIALLSISLSAQAQKYGYVNSDAILGSMNEVKEMTPALESLQAQLVRKGESMVTALKEKSGKAQQKMERGEMSPIEQEKVQAELQADQNKIMGFEQEMQQTIMKKRQELLQPILDKVNTAINAVAKAQGFTMIFNGSPQAGILLFVDGSGDVTAAVKTELGI